MNIKISGLMLLLLYIVFILGIGGCDRLRKRSSTVRTVQANSKPLNQKVAPPKQETAQEDDELALKDPNSSLSPREYGKENPFEPVVGRGAARGTRAINISRATQAETEVNNSESEITVRLTAILGENSAIFREGNADKSVSVGDTVAGMKVLEILIDEGKAVLGKGDDRLTIALGTEIKL